MIVNRSHFIPHPHSATKRAFTLIEILIVIALIGALAALALGNLGGIFGGQQEKIARQFVRDTARTALIAYRLDMGTYPSTEEGLRALIQAPATGGTRWRGPYLETTVIPEDPWGRPYQYRFPGQRNPNGPAGYDIWSFGPDGVDSDNNIGNWD
jgi:general secretion pathway protein G